MKYKEKRRVEEFNHLYIKYEARLEEIIKACLPERGEICGGTRGPSFALSTSADYQFDPPLTTEETQDLFKKLHEIGAKKICFSYVAGLKKENKLQNFLRKCG